MEFRYFYPISADSFADRWMKRADLENRTDIYFLLPARTNHADQFHLEHSLKLRNKKKLELKKRQQRLPNGQEYWIKTMRSYKSFHPEQFDAIIHALKQSNEDQLIERLRSVKMIILGYVSKYREQRHMGGNLIRECTGFHVKFIQSNNQTQIGKDLFFETVCIERGDESLIDEDMIKQVLQEHGNTSIQPMGYPEFLFQQYQQIINHQ